MGALTIAFDTTIVGALALPWVLLVIHLFFFEGENRLVEMMEWVKKQEQPAVAGVLLFAMTYTLGSAVSRIAQDFFNDDDLYVRVDGHLLRFWAIEDHVLARLYCDSDTDPNDTESGKTLLRANKGDRAVAEKIRHFRNQKSLCSEPLKWWAGHRYNNFISTAADIFGLQENALMAKGGDYSARLRQLHDQVMVLRGAAFNGAIGFSLCVFAWGATLRRKGKPTWWALAPVPLFYMGATLLALKHHLKEGFPPDPPYMEFTLLLLGAAGAWLMWRPPAQQAEHKAEVAARKSVEEKAVATAGIVENGFWQKERWAELVMLSAILTLAAGLGWWSTEIYYAKQVIYSYDTQAATPEAKTSSTDKPDGP
jgi:hypothetical protein